jgi:exosortase
VLDGAAEETGETAEKGALVSGMGSKTSWLGAFVLVLAAYLYYPSFFADNHRELAAQGEQFFFQANDAAGAPVLILSLWLFYRRIHYRDLLSGPGVIIFGSIVLGLSVALFGWGTYTKAADLQLMSAIALLAGVVLLFGGRAGFRAYWLPVLFLGFALPISPVLIAATIYPIQLATAQYAGLILNGLGFESLVVGDQILRTGGSFIVIETCSGVRTMVTLSMLTILLIDLFERRGIHAALLIGLAPIVAFLVNGIRVVTLVLNPYSSIHSVHNLQGIGMLLVGLTTLYLIDGLLEPALQTGDSASVRGDYGIKRTGRSSPTKRAACLVGIALVLVSMIGLDRMMPRWSGPSGLDEKPDELLARIFGADPSTPYPMDYNFVGSVHYLEQAQHRVEIGGAVVEIHLGVANEKLRGYSILTKRLAWPATGYAPIEESFVEIGDEGPLARRMLFRRGLTSTLSYSWIERRGSLPVEWFRQAAALDRSRFARPAHMLAIRLSTTIGRGAKDLEQAEVRIRRVWAELAPELVDFATMK